MANAFHYFRWLHRALSIHASSNKPKLLSKVERRPGSRWGKPGDEEGLVFEAKLEHIKRGQTCSKQYLIDGFEVCLSLLSYEHRGTNYPAVGFRLRAYEGREYGEDCQVVKFGKFQWKTAWHGSERQSEPELSGTTRDVVIEGQHDGFIRFGWVAGVKWSGFIKDYGPFFDNRLFRLELQLQLITYPSPSSYHLHLLHVRSAKTCHIIYIIN